MRGDDDADYTTYVSARLTALHRAAYVLCGGDKDCADDMVQVTITKLYQHWRRARRADNLDAYVHRMLVHSYIDEKRRSWARVWLLPRTSETFAGIDEPHGVVDDRDVVLAALRTLPPRQRSVLALRYLLDQPVQEVAEILGCSEGSVKSQSSRALATLRAALLDRSTTKGAV